MAKKISIAFCILVNGAPTRFITATAQTNTIKPNNPSNDGHMERR